MEVLAQYFAVALSGVISCFDLRNRLNIIVSESRAHSLYGRVSAGVAGEISARPPMQPQTESEKF